MYAWLVINEFLNSNKFNEIYKWLEKATIKHNNKIDVFTNSDLLICNGKFLNPDITKNAGLCYILGQGYCTGKTA